MEVAGPDRPHRRTGRPLSFDRAAALEQAMLAFWRHGYETTSVADLTTAMNITAPSLYAAFGDKKRLFLEAAHRYAGTDAVAQAIDAAPTALDAARAMLTGAATTYTGEATPRGCLLASATASGSDASSDVQAVVAGIRRLTRDRLRRKIERDVGNGLLPPSTDATVLANLVLTIAQGMSVLARDGAGRDALLAIVGLALQVWPRANDASPG